MSIIKIARGLKANMPTLQDGQQYLCTDDNEIYIGSSGINRLFGVYQFQRTYDELKKEKDANNLIPGCQYLLTDYITKYQQPVTLTMKSADQSERLVLTAISTDRFDRQCKSLDFPQDDIWYDFDNNKCEDASTPRNGFILRRHDTIRNINCPHDWRKIQYARFQMKFDGISNWSKGASVTRGTMYACNKILAIATATGLPYGDYDTTHFRDVILEDKLEYFLYDDAFDFIADKNNVLQTYMFLDPDSSTLRDIYVGDMSEGKLINTVFYDTSAHDINIGRDCFNNTFAVGTYNTTFKNNCHSNYLGYHSFQNTFGDNCYQCIFHGLCWNNTLSTDCYSMTLSSRSGDNTFGMSCYNVILETNCSDNNFGHSNYDVKCGQHCEHNIFGDSEASGTTLPDNCSLVYVNNGVGLGGYGDLQWLQNIDNTTRGRLTIDWCDGKVIYWYIGARGVIEYHDVP